MGGMLDSNRFRYYISQALGVHPAEVDGFVIGGHGDKTMIPLHRFATYNGRAISELLPAEKIDEIVKATMVGGATLTGLLGTSAWYAPGAAGAMVVKAIVRNERKLVPCSVYLEGEYGQEDICIGVPVVLGTNGVEAIVEYDLNDEEKALFEASANATRGTNAALADALK